MRTHSTTNLTCEHCGKGFYRPPGRTHPGQTNTHCQDCRILLANEPAHIAARFWLYVRKTDSCWLWTGSTKGGGYGIFRPGGASTRSVFAHRFSWSLVNGPLPDDIQVLHNCPSGDNPLCVNPAYLWLGDQQANVRDCWAKGRHIAQRGEASPVSKLTATDVLAIRTARAAGIQGVALSKRYGVSEQAICTIFKRRSWEHLP